MLADVNGTSGIQAQAYASSVLTTLRKGITKLEIAGYTPCAFVLTPADWEGVELALLEPGCDRAPVAAVRSGDPAAVRGSRDHVERAGRRRRTRAGHGCCCAGH